MFPVFESRKMLVQNIESKSLLSLITKNSVCKKHVSKNISKAMVPNNRIANNL